MTSSLQKIIESKLAFRRELASETIAEKLRMLESMRERQSKLRIRVRRTPNPKTGFPE